MTVTPEWRKNDDEQEILYLLHEGKWTFAEMGQALQNAVGEDTSDPFVAVCIFPDEFHFPPDAISGASRLVRRPEFKKFKGLVCVRHPLDKYFDLRVSIVERLMSTLSFPIRFTKTEDSILQEIEQLSAPPDKD